MSATAFLHRHRRSVGGAALSVLVVALVVLASLPTGTDTAAGAVPAGARLAVSADAADVEVQVISTHGALSVQVAYRASKGWLAAALPAAPTDAVAAWTGTRGSGSVPALSVLYGRVAGIRVLVDWADGTHSRVDAKSDGVFIAVRDRFVEATRARVLDSAGTTVLEIGGF